MFFYSIIHIIKSNLGRYLIIFVNLFFFQVVQGKLPINHQIIYQLQDIFNLLPDVSQPAFKSSLYVKTNDQMLVVYLAALVRSVIALHNLINNKLANRDAEKKEASKKEESITAALTTAASATAGGKDETKKK